MAVEAGQVHQRHADQRIADILYNMYETFDALVQAGLPPQVAEAAAQRLVAQRMQGGGERRARPEQAPQPVPVAPPRIQIPNPARAEAMARVPAHPGQPPFRSPLNAVSPSDQRNYGEASIRYNNALGAYNNAVAAAQAIPEMIDDPNQPPAPEIKEREEKHAAEAVQQARQAPGPFGDDMAPPRQAPLDAAQLAAFALAQNPPDYARPQGALVDARAASNRGAERFPAHAADYMNPYTQQVVDRIRDDGLRTFNEGIMPALEAKFVRMGQHGGSRHATLAQRAARDLQRSILDAQGQARHSGYRQGADIFNADQLRQLANAENIKNFGLAGQGINLANISALADAGRIKQGHAQQKKDIGFQDWMRQREEPFLRLAQQSALMRGHHMPMTQESYQYTPPAPQLNNWGNIGSIAGQLLGATMQQPRGRKSGGRVTLNLGRR